MSGLHSKRKSTRKSWRLRFEKFSLWAKEDVSPKNVSEEVLRRASLSECPYCTFPPICNFLVSLAKLTPNDCAVVIPEPALPPPSPCPASPNSENPLLLVLFAEPIIERLASSLKRLIITPPSYRSWLPYPAIRFPIHPFFIPFLTVKSKTGSSSPSSIPVIRAISLFLS